MHLLVKQNIISRCAHAGGGGSIAGSLGSHGAEKKRRCYARCTAKGMRRRARRAS